MVRTTRILIGLVLGLLLGVAVGTGAHPLARQEMAAVAATVGGMWVDALRMTIVPLIVSLLVTGIATAAEAARAGTLTLRALIIFLLILAISSVIGAVLLPLFTALWPLPQAGLEALRSTLAGARESIPPVPGTADFLRSLIPANPIAAAAGDAILPLIVFSGIFGFAITRLPAEKREGLISIFAAIADAMLIVIGWVLWLAPVGVFALAFAVAARVGTQAIGALLHYVLLLSSVGCVIWLLAYALARIGAGISLGRFARALAPAQALAISTRSSLACFRPMLDGARQLGVPAHAADVVLPLAVALFRATGPAMNLSAALYVAYLLGIPLGPPQIAAGIVVATISTISAVSLPGEISFITSIAPIALAMGVPIEPLALLIAVETVPDMFRTLGNVTADVAVTAIVAKGEPHMPQDDSAAIDE